jgi:hypothetical protein
MFNLKISSSDSKISSAPSLSSSSHSECCTSSTHSHSLDSKRKKFATEQEYEAKQSSFEQPHWSSDDDDANENDGRHTEEAITEPSLSATGNCNNGDKHLTNGNRLAASHKSSPPILNGHLEEDDVETVASLSSQHSFPEN